jgi:hypothetical protein
MVARSDFEKTFIEFQAQYRAFEVVDPTSGSSSDIVHARQTLFDDLAARARREYVDRGLPQTDLRDESDRQLRERADVLAVMTAPTTPKERQLRTHRIAAVFGVILSGQTLRVIPAGTAGLSEEVTADPDRALFAVFGDHSHYEGRLTFQYDKPYSWPTSADGQPGERLLQIDVPSLFVPRPLMIEPVAAPA